MTLVRAMSTSTSSDLELLRASQRGHLDAFADLVGRYQPLVSAVAFSATGDRAMTEDVAQETFLVAWVGIRSIREPLKLRSWLCGIARNLGLATLRKGKREIATADTELEEASSDVQPSPLDAALSRESEALVRDAIRRIPELYRLPCVLHYRENYSVAEIAQILDLQRSTVQQRLSRGRRCIRKSMAELVERTLSQHKPAKGFVAGVMGLIAAGSLPSAAQASLSATKLVATTGALKGTVGATSMNVKIALGIGMVGATALAALTFASGVGVQPVKEKRGATLAQPGINPGPGHGAMNTAPAAAIPSSRAETRAGDESFDDLEENVVSSSIRIDGKPASDDFQVPDELSMCFFADTEASIAANARFTIVKDSGPARVSNVQLWGQHPYSDAPAVEDCVRREVLSLELEPGEHQIAFEMWVKPEPAQPSAEVVNMIEAPSERSRGPVDAPIVIIQFSDFGDRFSGELLGTLDQLFEEYPGKLRLVVKQGRDSTGPSMAAPAAIAAAAQNTFWPMHDRLFQNQDAQEGDDVVGYAKDLGLNLARFKRDMDSEQTRQQITADAAEAKALGVVATPTLIINGVRVRGALSIEMYRARFDRILGK